MPLDRAIGMLISRPKAAPVVSKTASKWQLSPSLLWQAVPLIMQERKQHPRGDVDGRTRRSEQSMSAMSDCLRVRFSTGQSATTSRSAGCAAARSSRSVGRHPHCADLGMS